MKAPLFCCGEGLVVRKKGSLNKVSLVEQKVFSPLYVGVCNFCKN